MIRIIQILLINLFITVPAFADGFKVVILGTGTPMSNPDRSGPGVAIIAGGKAYIVDSGAGIVRRAIAASRNGTPELAVAKLDTVFLTHLHSDHTAGLSNMVLAPWVLRRAAPLTLYGPPGTKHMADNILEAYEQDINVRINGSQPANPEGYKVNATEFSNSGIIHEDDNVTVEAFKVLHGTWQHAYGYKFTEKLSGKVAVVSGDTTYSEALIKVAMNADILVHEVFLKIALDKRTPDWQAYHSAFHTSPQQIVEIGKKTKPKIMILYHQLYWDPADDNLEEEVIAAGYEGKVISANDLDVFQ